MPTLDASIPIGALFALSGPLAVADRAQVQGFLLGVAEVNQSGGVAGRPLSPFVKDTQSQPEQTLTLASQMTGAMGIRDIFGCSDSRGRKAVLPLLERRAARLWYSAQFEGFELSPNVVYGGACPNQHAAPLIDYLINVGLGQIALIGNDYVFAHETNRVARRKIRAHDATPTTEAYLPIGCTDADIARMVEAVPLGTDAVVLSLVGLDCLRFCQAFREAGRHALIASVAASEIDLSGESDALLGLIAVSSYFDCVRNAQTQDFQSKFHKRYGADTAASWHAANTYDQVIRFAALAELVDYLDRDRGFNLNDALGFGSRIVDNSIDTCSHYAFHTPRIAQVNRRKKFELIHEADTVIAPDPYCVTYA